MDSDSGESGNERAAAWLTVGWGEVGAGLMGGH